MPHDTRLFALIARNAPVAVIFRRGPTKRVLLVRWDMATDTFDEGQWLKGRIYERRCDLSPDGDLLLYFAASYKKPYFSWTAVSKPPYLTALALWPKGDGWGGGGHFKTGSRIALNHRENETALGEGFSIPPWLTVRPFGSRSGWGEDNPVWSSRLEREGWISISHAEIAKENFNAKVWIEFDPPTIWEKRHPIAPERYLLRMTIRGVYERDGRWYLTDHAVLSNGDVAHALDKSDWADWSPSGDLVFTKDSCVYRMSFSNGTLGEARQLIDLGERTFESREAPPEARSWPVR